MSFSSVQNPICCEVFNSKSDQSKNVNFKMWCVVKFCFEKIKRCFPWIQNLTRCNFLYSKSDMSDCYKSKSSALFFLYSNFDELKFSSIPNLTRCKILTQSLAPFFQNPTRCFLFRSNTDQSKKINFKIWCVDFFCKYRIWHLVKWSEQNLLHCSFCFKIRCVVFVWF